MRAGLSIITPIALAMCLLLSACSQRVTLNGATPEAAGQTPVTPVVEAQPEWFACDTNTDCMATKSVCGGNASVNKKFDDLYQQFVKRMAPMVDCAPIKEEPPAKVDCVQKRCAVITNPE